MIKPKTQTCSSRDITRLKHQILRVRDSEFYYKKLTEALRESEERYRNLFNGVNDAMFVLSMGHDGIPARFMEVNDYACDRLGYSREELLALPPQVLIPPEHLDEASSNARRLVAQTVHRFETDLLCKDGRRIPFEVSAHAFDLKGEATIISMGRDISERKWAEEALQERNAVLEAVFSNIHLLGAFLDRDFRFVRVNQAFSLYEDRPPEFFIGQSFFSLYPDHNKEMIFRELLEKREPYFAEEHPFFSSLHPNRGATYWDWSVQPVQGPGERLYGVVLCLLDRTERRRAQDALQESEQRFHAIFDSSLDAIALLDDSARLLDVNSAACSLVGMTREEIIGKHVTAFMETTDEFHTAWRMLHQDKWVKGDVTIKQADGSVRDIEYASTANFLPGQHLSVLRDITKRKQMQAALEKSEKQLRFLSTRLLTVQEEEKSRLAQELHDNIGQVLAAIKFGVENALRAANRQDTKATARSLNELIPVIQASIQEARRMFTALRPSILDDLGIVAAIDWLARETLAACPEIEFEKNVEINEWEIPKSSRIAIFRIVQEALSNICLHSKASRASIHFARKNSFLELAITDNGLGFDLARTPSTGDRDQGFGLLSMRELAELSGGTFRADSHEGEGTTIRASWPSLDEAFQPFP